MRLQSMGGFCVFLVMNGCAAPEVEEARGSSTSELGGTPGFIPAEAVGRRFPVTPWRQPPSEGVFAQYGYCGATAVANLLALYGVHKAPRDAVDEGCWSLVGTTPGDMIGYLDDRFGSLGCGRRFIGGDEDALSVLGTQLRENRPPIVLFKNGTVNSHWVVVVGISRRGDERWVEYMTDGEYQQSRWADLEPRWSSVYGMRYPMLTCSAVARFRDYRVE